MQQCKLQVLIVPAENQADFSASAHPCNGEIDYERGPAAQQPESPWGFDKEICPVSPQCNEAGAQGQPRRHEDQDSGVEEDEGSPYPELKVDDAPFAGPDNLPMLWTMDEETVLMHSSQGSLERIRMRLETLLLGVSDAIRVRKVHGASQDRTEGTLPRSRRGRSGSRPVVDFPKQVLAADHAFRHIVGEAFDRFTKVELIEMLQLCSLADKGATECYELVGNAVVVLHTLMHDGEAVRDLAHFRQFVVSHRAEISSPKWQHDFVTALRSLAVGFLRHPEAIMAFYGNSVNQIVQHEALYVALLRLCSGRNMGSTPAPLNTASQDGHAAPKRKSPNGVASTRRRASRRRTPMQSKHKTSSLHKRRNESGSPSTRQSSTSRLDSIMKLELPRCVTLSISSTPPKRRNGGSKSRSSNTMWSRSSASTGKKKCAPAPSKNAAQASVSTSASRVAIKSTKLIPENSCQLILPCTRNPSLLHL